MSHTSEKPALATPATKPETLDGKQFSKTGAPPSTSLHRSPWRTLAAWIDEREGDPLPPASPPDRENESVEQRARRRGFREAGHSPDEHEPAERPDDGFGTGR